VEGYHPTMTLVANVGNRINIQVDWEETTIYDSVANKQ